MSDKLIVSIVNITEEQTRAIRDTAKNAGWDVEFFTDVKEALPAAKDAEVVFGDTPKFVKAAPDLKWICCPSAGINHFTRSEEFMNSGVMLSNSSGAYGTAISEHIIMVTLAMLRKLPEYQEMVSKRKWRPAHSISSIRGSRITILGTGDIGRETAKRLRAFYPKDITGLNTTGHDESGAFDRVIGSDMLSEVLPKTDILIMALPGTKNTDHIMDERNLRLLKDGALIVNVGRGSLIDEEALLKELKSGRLRAALDVFEKEPIPVDSDLWDCPNLLITPHVAGDMYLPYTVERIVEMFLEDFRRYIKGEKPVRAVDLRKGY